MARVIMTSAQLVERLKKLASRRTFYKNVYPYNLCYIHGDGRTSADCVNLYKALLNGYDVNVTATGYFQSSLSNTGDCTEWGLLQQCSDISGDFRKLKAGEPRLLYMSGHIGGYIGEEVSRNGHIYNVIECTTSWGGGIIYSYVDADGWRLQFKGASRTKRGNGSDNRWTSHGKMTPWVNYITPTPQPTPQPTPSKTIDELAKEVIQGKWGNEPERSKRLTEAGYDARAVQDRVNEMLAPSKEYYTVKKGDIFSGIAMKYKVTQKKLKELNPQIKDINKIYVGQKIRVK